VFLVKHDKGVPDATAERLRSLLQESFENRQGFYEFYVYRGGVPGGDVVVRLSTAHAVVPFLVRPADWDSGSLRSLVKNALSCADA
jgi:hypothetical protein